MILYVILVLLLVGLAYAGGRAHSTMLTTKRIKAIEAAEANVCHHNEVRLEALEWSMEWNDKRSAYEHVCDAAGYCLGCAEPARIRLPIRKITGENNTKTWDRVKEAMQAKGYLYHEGDNSYLR